MNAELLAMLTAKTSSFELSSNNHDAVTSEDIAHYLGTKGLNSIEYDFLMAKYTDNTYSRSLVFDNIYQDIFDIFKKNINMKELKNNRFLLTQFINLALRETMYPNCFVCQGRGTVINNERIEKCQHCEGTGQFIYNDDNRPEFIGIDKKEFMKFKVPYIKSLDYIKNIENSALYKIGDEQT
tara:strand:- start:571 stop:1116 length:546 start_codon:yes stop_codon:yes gene_type:complete